MINRAERYHAEKHTTPIDKNERMTAMAGAVLFIFIIAELFITANIHGMIVEHIFVGILLTGPLVIKMISTGYRFIRYYTKSSEFVRKGPPNILLRILAPFLVLTTILIFISGFGMVFGHNKLFFKIHAASVALWIPLTAVHVYAYLRKVPRLITKDWGRHSKNQVPGRKWRLSLNIGALTAGAVAAIVLLPFYARGNGKGHHTHHVLHLFHDIPAPLSLGILAAIIAIIVCIPLLRLTNKAINK